MHGVYGRGTPVQSVQARKKHKRNHFLHISLYNAVSTAGAMQCRLMCEDDTEWWITIKIPRSYSKLHPQLIQCC